MIVYLNSAAGALKRNMVGDIEVVVTGIDATPKLRRRGIRKNVQLRSKKRKSRLTRPAKKRAAKTARKRR
jgi:hypothetical protein